MWKRSLENKNIGRNRFIILRVIKHLINWLTQFLAQGFEESKLNIGTQNRADITPILIF